MKKSEKGRSSVSRSSCRLTALLFLCLLFPLSLDNNLVFVGVAVRREENLPSI